MISRNQNLNVIEELTARLEEDICDIEREVTANAVYTANIMEAMMSGNLDSLPVVERPNQFGKWANLWPFGR